MDTDLVEEVRRRAHMTRRDILRRAGVGGLALTAPGVLAACGSDNKTSSGTAGGSASTSNEPIAELRWVTTDQVFSLDGAKDYAGLNPGVIATESILVYDDDEKIVGHLAESWEVVDPVTYVYKVRQGVKFWDGTPLTAEDIAYAMSRHLDPKTESVLAGLIPAVASIEVTGDDEVTVKLEKPDATWEQVPTTLFVAPKAFLQRLGKDYGTPGTDTVMGTGPYKVTEFRDSEVVSYVANDDYWGPKPNVRRLTYKSVKDAQVAVLAAQAGDVDGSFDMSAAQLSDWKALPNMTVTVVPSSNMTFFALDTAAKPFDDIHVRKALAYALDREGLLKAIVKGNGQIANSIVPRAQWGGSYDKAQVDEIYASLPAYDFDLDKAKAELAQSAYPKGLTVPVWFYSNDADAQQIAVTWAEALARIGVKLKLDSIETTEGEDRQSGHHDLGMHLNNEWGADYADPIDFAVVCLPSYAAKPGSYNEANYKNPTVDKLIAENMAATDPKVRADKLGQAMKIAQEDVPYIPMWTPFASIALKKGLTYKDYSPLHRQQSWVDNVSKA